MDPADGHREAESDLEALKRIVMILSRGNIVEKEREISIELMFDVTEIRTGIDFF